MSDMEVTEGRLLSQAFEAGGPPAAVEVPPPPRTVETVTLEIRTLQHQAQGIILNYAIEIGRRLEEAKAMLTHGEWGAWLKRELDFSQSTANNFMRIFREYGAAQQSLFGGEAKSQSLANLTYTKALRLLAIPDEEERERFIAGHDVEGMSSRELDKALKEREEALEAAAAAEEETRKLRQETERLQGQLTDQAQVYRAKLTSADVETTEAKRKAREALEALNRQKDKAQRLQDALSAANTSAQAAEEEHARLLQKLEELRSRPVDVAVEVDEEAVEAARKAAVAEMTEKVDKAKDAKKKADMARKAAEEALAAAQKELEELKAKEPQVRELTQEEKDALTAEAVNKAKAEDAERLRGLEKQLASADPNVAEFKVRIVSWHDEYWKMADALGRISKDDKERAARLWQAVIAELEPMATHAKRSALPVQ